MNSNPDLYIVDISIEFVILLSNGKVPVDPRKKKQSTTILKVEKMPILLKEGKIPTRNQEIKLFNKIHKKFKVKESIERLKVMKIEIYNAKFSSKIQWNFDYDND